MTVSVRGEQIRHGRMNFIVNEKIVATSTHYIFKYHSSLSHAT